MSNTHPLLQAPARDPQVKVGLVRRETDEKTTRKDRKEQDKKEVAKLKPDERTATKEKEQREQGQKNKGRERMLRTPAKKLGCPRSPGAARVAMPLPLNAENLRANRGAFVETEMKSELNRALGDMTRTFIEGMVPEEELQEYLKLESIKKERG